MWHYIYKHMRVPLHDQKIILKIGENRRKRMLKKDPSVKFNLEMIIDIGRKNSR